MEKTGIVRRIDELGRIVIPKEMRKSLLIKDFDPLEISIENSRIMLSKYSPLNNYLDISKTISKSVNKKTDKTCLITDREFLICNSKNESLSFKCPISKEMLNIILNREQKLLCDDTIKGLKICDNIESYSNIFVSPITIGGDVLGSIILLSNVSISDIDIKIVSLATDILSRYFE